MNVVNYLIISHTVGSGENEVLQIPDIMRQSGFQNVVFAIRPGCAVDFIDLRTTIELAQSNQSITSVHDPTFDPTLYPDHRIDAPAHTYLLKTDATKYVRSSFDGSEIQGINIPNYKIGYSEDLDPRLYGVYDASHLGECLNDEEFASVVDCIIQKGDPIIQLKDVLSTEISNNSGDIKPILENYYFPNILTYHKRIYGDHPYNIIIFNCGSHYSHDQAVSLRHDIVNQSGYKGGKINYKKKYLKYKLKYLKLKQF